MASLGIAQETMATTTGLSVGYIKRLFEDKHNETFNRLRDDYIARRTKEVVGAHFELSAMLAESYGAIGEALRGGDKRVAAENAWRLIERVCPDPKQKDGGLNGLQIILNQPEIQTQVGETMTTVAECLLGLREAIAGQQADEHVLTGTDALPTPPSQLEVTAGGAPLTPTQNPDDLLTELMDKDE
jgi:hypothetical protein